MSCLGCNLIEIETVTLQDGTVVCIACPLFAEEVEAKILDKEFGLD